MTRRALGRAGSQTLSLNPVPPLSDVHRTFLQQFWRELTKATSLVAVTEAATGGPRFHPSVEMAPKSHKRDKQRMASMMPRTGGQIKELQNSYQKKELMEWVDANTEMLGTLLFVCKSGMLKEVEADLRKEHWLPPSNVYFHNVARAFFGFALGKLEPRATIELLQVLTNKDSDTIWKLLFLATHTSRNTRVPSTHKISFLSLLEQRRTSLGKPLSKIDWQKASRTKQLDWSKMGLFEVVYNNDKDITGLRYVPKGIDYKFPRPVPGRLQLENNWCLQEARLLDPNDEEDPIRILRRFKELHGDWGFSVEETEAAEQANNADAVRIAKDEECGAANLQGRGGGVRGRGGRAGDGFPGRAATEKNRR